MSKDTRRLTWAIYILTTATEYEERRRKLGMPDTYENFVAGIDPEKLSLPWTVYEHVQRVNNQAKAGLSNRALNDPLGLYLTLNWAASYATFCHAGGWEGFTDDCYVGWGVRLPLATYEVVMEIIDAALALVDSPMPTITLSAQALIQKEIADTIKQYEDEATALSENLFGDGYNICNGLVNLSSVLRLEAKAHFFQRFAGKAITIDLINQGIADATRMLRIEARTGADAVQTLIASERAYAFAALITEMEFWVTLLSKETQGPAQLTAE